MAARFHCSPLKASNSSSPDMLNLLKLANLPNLSKPFALADLKEVLAKHLPRLPAPDRGISRSPRRTRHRAGSYTEPGRTRSACDRSRPVDRNWLEALCAPFDDPDVAAVWGPSLRQGRPLSDPGPPILQQPGSYGFENRTWGLSNANSALRRPLWEQFPFDERLQAAEDKAWGMEAMSRGFTIAHEPRAAVWHERHTVRNAYLRNRKVAEGFSMIFPGAQDPKSGTVGRVGAAGTRSLWFNLRNPHPVTIWRDLRRVPSTVAAVVGAYRYRGRR